MSKSIMMMKLKTNGEKKTLYVQDSDGEFAAVDYTDEVQGWLEDWKTDKIGDADLLNLIDVDLSKFASKISETVNTRLQKLSERISTDGMHIYIDGDDFEKVQLDKALEDHMVRMLTTKDDSEDEKRNWASFVAFTENLYNNTDPDIRVQIFSWMEAQGWLTLTEDGCIIGYKGCQKNESTGIAESISRGPGIVDGVIYNGHIPNPDGAVVEIAKSLVEKNASVGCASGLHVGTYDYAYGFARGVICKVKMNPRDIISVPYDCNAQKVRCCRYEVIEHTDVEYSWNWDVPRDRVFSDALSWGADVRDGEYPEAFLDWAYENFDFDSSECECEFGWDCDCLAQDKFDEDCPYYEEAYAEQFDTFCKEMWDEWRYEYADDFEDDENDEDDVPSCRDYGCGCAEEAVEVDEDDDNDVQEDAAAGPTEPVCEIFGLNDYLRAIGQEPETEQEQERLTLDELRVTGDIETDADKVIPIWSDDVEGEGAPVTEEGDLAEGYVESADVYAPISDYTYGVETEEPVDGAVDGGIEEDTVSPLPEGYGIEENDVTDEEPTQTPVNPAVESAPRNPFRFGGLFGRNR